MFTLKEKKPSEKPNPSHKLLLKLSDLDIEECYQALETSRQGLSFEEAETRLERFGKNILSRTTPPTWYSMLLNNFKNPFVMVLIILGTVSYFTEDIKATIVISIMVLVSVIMRFSAEFHSNRSAETLRSMVRTKATVRRYKLDELQKIIKVKKDIPLEELVPGDIIYLTAGDMIPADVRLIRSKDLFISQSALTGESTPVGKFNIPQTLIEKSTRDIPENSLNPLEKDNLCFMGTSVASGFGKAIVVATGNKTYFGALAESIISGDRPQTSFDKGVTDVTWILIRFILVMIPIVFLINGFIKHDWQESFLFALAVAVGLTPEMLPMIVTANLAKGAVAMSKFKVIVKRLNSIQSLGAMDILCTDKTGTLTQDKIILDKYLDTQGRENNRVLMLGFLNSYFQSGLKNMLDRAILDHGPIERALNPDEDYKKIDEIPFDFFRKRLSVIVRQNSEQQLLICKGSVEELLGLCSTIEKEDSILPKTTEIIEAVLSLTHDLNSDGFRVIAVTYKNLPLEDRAYSLTDEKDMTFLGLMAFLDPPKETATEAIKILRNHHVNLKILTGDNEVITHHICKEVHLPTTATLLGPEIELLSDEELAKAAENTTIFAKLSPLQKSRIIMLLQKNGHIVGYLGDGINDASGLKVADVGISVDSATDIARESADIILLEKSLLVLGEGVLNGRTVYGNIIKYIKMTTSSNFGNVFSVLIASAFLPFLPMLPLQLLIQNLLYDFSQLSLPWDKMDKDFLKKTRKWEPRGIVRFMFFIGPISSVFDITTFLLMWYVFKANTLEKQALFQSGWFVEGLLSQILIVHMIRTQKIPFVQSNASPIVILTTLAIMLFGIYIPFSSLGGAAQLTPLPLQYFFYLGITLFCYCVAVQLVKIWYIKKFHSWL